MSSCIWTSFFSCALPCDVCRCHENCTKLYYVPIPKTASETTRSTLGRAKLVNSCWVRPGPHKASLHLSAITTTFYDFIEYRPFDVVSTCTDHEPLRFATMRSPYERFASTFFAIFHQPLHRLNSLDVAGYRQALPSFQAPVDLLRNSSAMQYVLNGAGAGHFIPAIKFLCNEKVPTVHVLIQFAQLEASLKFIFSKVREVVVDVPHVNDPFPGDHKYQLTMEEQRLIEHYYPDDVSAFFRRPFSWTSVHCEVQSGSLGIQFCQPPHNNKRVHRAKRLLKVG
jgi:hypothetical protein